MTKPALQHLKESFPDLDEKEMDKMVEVMKRYARECVKKDRESIIEVDPVCHKEIPAMNSIFYQIDAECLLNLEIETP